MDSQYEEGEIITQKSDQLEPINSESSLRSLSDTNGDERVCKLQQEKLCSFSYVCAIYNFLGHCTQVGCKKRHILLQDGLEQFFQENIQLLTQLINNGEKIRVPYEKLLNQQNNNKKPQLIKPQVMTNYNQELCEKYKRALTLQLRKDIDKMQDKLKTICYLKKWVRHNFVDARDFNELYYSLNATQQIHFMNFFKVLELQPSSFQ
ncbi:unnamed protein product [Paramecium pentaurelia]|uniref:Uncharacterized protein n=1 Tax=Paramecium pentaurelia TaxID=43138 RepID=A0A8S1SIR7_9CILI|nr:unnamed protein product [Paramecium pentaurelia]